MPPDYDPELLALANDLRIACQRISRRVRFECTSDVAPHQFSVLMGLRNEGARTPTQLAARDSVSTPSMTKTVNCLADKGLVCRTPHPDDGRQVLVGITDAGLKVIDDTVASRDTWMLDHMAALDAEQLEVLRRASAILSEVSHGE